MSRRVEADSLLRLVQSEEQFEPLIDPGQFGRRHVAVNASHSPLEDRPHMVRQDLRRPGESAWTRRQRRIQRAIARRPGDRDHGNQREALVDIDDGGTHRNAGSNAALLVAKGGIEFHKDDGSAPEGHARPFFQPLPSTQVRCGR